jgi:thioester reductase-like protein
MNSYTDPTQLLTGATGSLGSHILHQLVRRQDVDHVYCLVRASSSKKSKTRVLAALEKARLLPEIDQKHFSKIVALPCDLSRSDLGLDPSIEEEMKRKVTSVIHSAWFVNFNMDVQSFEEDHIKGNVDQDLSLPKN